MKQVILRIDDIGAASKYNEQYGRALRLAGKTIPFPVSHVGPLKRLPPFRGWGPYREMSPEEWEQTFELLATYGAHLTVCITAAWVEDDNSLTPFPQKFPAQAKLLKDAAKSGLIEIGNHGLTHCVLGEHKPRLLRGNRTQHREFWDWLPDTLHAEHLKRAQTILTDYFGPIITLTPPGNQWTRATESEAQKVGLRFISARFPDWTEPHALTWTDQHTTYAFHDREIVLEGVPWLKNLLATLKDKNEQGRSVKDLYA